jgi:hypothetical protein
MTDFCLLWHHSFCLYHMTKGSWLYNNDIIIYNEINYIYIYNILYILFIIIMKLINIYIMK